MEHFRPKDLKKFDGRKENENWDLDLEKFQPPMRLRLFMNHVETLLRIFEQAFVNREVSTFGGGGGIFESCYREDYA